MKVVVTAFTLAVIFTLGAGGVLVTSANAAAPGSLLYPLDRGMENLHLELTTNPEATAHLEAQYAVERLEEVQDLLRQGKTEYLDEALTEAGIGLAELEESANPQTSLTPEAVKGLLNIAFDVQAPAEDPGPELEETVPPVVTVDPATTDTPEETEEPVVEVTAEVTEEVIEGEEPEVTEEPTTFKQPKSGIHCGGGGGGEVANQPAGDKLAAEFGASYDDVIGWFCKGYGFGEIKLAYMLSQTGKASLDEIFELRGSGMGWGNILKQFGMIGKGAKGGPKNPKNPPAPVTTEQPANSSNYQMPNPNVHMNGNGKGNGNSNGNTTNNGKGHGNGKGKP